MAQLNHRIFEIGSTIMEKSRPHLYPTWTRLWNLLPYGTKFWMLARIFFRDFPKRLFGNSKVGGGSDGMNALLQPTGRNQWRHFLSGWRYLPALRMYKYVGCQFQGVARNADDHCIQYANTFFERDKWKTLLYSQCDYGRPNEHISRCIWSCFGRNR